MAAARGKLQPTVTPWFSAHLNWSLPPEYEEKKLPAVSKSVKTGSAHSAIDENVSTLNKEFYFGRTVKVSVQFG